MRWLFPDRCRVLTFSPMFDPATGVTNLEPTVLIEALPCRVSFRRYPAGEEVCGAVKLVQGIRLYSPSRVELPDGAWIEYGGRTYRRMGASAVYPSHRESDLILEEMA